MLMPKDDVKTKLRPHIRPPLNSALPSIEMKIMSMKSTMNTPINPTDDVNAITDVADQ
jgi:hypothetical protein